MRKLPRDVGPAAELPCRVVTADQVAQLRAVSPDSAIVAVVGSTDQAQAVAAQLAGADVVLPGDGPPDPAVLTAACDAARQLRHRFLSGRRTHELALHDLRTGVQSTVMLADLLEAEPTRTDRVVRLLRALADSNGSALDDLADATPPDGRPDSPVLAQAEILEGIAGRVPLSRSLHAVVEAMEAQLPGSICSILLVDAEAGTLTHGAGPHLPEQYRAAIDGVSIGPLTGSCGTAAHDREPVIAVDIATDPRWADYRDMALQHGLRACWSTPILDADRHEVLGTFAVYHDRPWQPAESEMDLVNRFTHTAAIAIGTHGLFSRLAESESRFRSAFEGTGVGMALVSPDGTLLQTNPALGRMLGSDDDIDAPAGRLTDRVHPDDVAAVEHALRSCLAEAVAVRLPEVRLRRPEGAEPLWTALSGSLVRGPDGAPRHLVLELFDLTERRRVAQARREQAMAEAASQAKTELLALVSHELRTPLNAVIGFAQVMQLVELDPQRREGAVEHILTAGRHLLQVINDLLDLTAAETGRLVPDRDRFDPADTVRETVDLLAGLALQSGITLAAELPEPTRTVIGDPRRLRQVLINLVGNAVKFTPAGGLVTVGWDGTALRVTDTGPGIPPAEIPQLFTPFHRYGREGGSGLGLALSDRLMRAMGGTLRWVPGPGTTFEVRLPTGGTNTVKAGEPTVGLPPTEIVAAAGDPSGRVLCVEDDRAGRDLVTAALACWPQVDLVTVGDLHGARRALHRADRPIDLVLLDLDLPDGSGWELLAEPVAQHLPVVVVSAGLGSAPDDVAVTAQLPKPLMVQDLRSVVARLLSPAVDGSRRRP